MEKAYKFRIYPNKWQEEQIQKTFGSCRFVYNRFLAFRKSEWEENKETINYEVKTSDLYPEIDVQKGLEPNIGELTVSVCPEGWPVEPAATKVNICNLGKAPLIISKIEFSDNSGLFEIEPINLPAKISNPGLEKTCIENLSICYSKEAIPGDSTTVTIFSNSTSLENYYIQVTAGN